MQNEDASAAMPDEFDRLLGALDGVGTTTKDAIVTVVPPLGVGGSRKFILRTVRHDGQDTVFVEMISRARSYREVLPPEVMIVLNRQHESLAAQARSRRAQTGAATRMAAGWVPTPPPPRKKRKQ